MTLYVYVDNSNLWIEGMRVSAVKTGMATSLQDAMDRNITDHGWAYDFGKLYKAICPDTEKIGRSSLFGSRPPANDSLWDLARDEGFQSSHLTGTSQTRRSRSTSRSRPRSWRTRSSI